MFESKDPTNEPVCRMPDPFHGRCGSSLSAAHDLFQHKLHGSKMFSLTSLKALKGATCPELTTCKRDPCLYSHESSKPPPPQRPPSAGNSSTVRAEAGPSSSDAAVKRALPPLDKFSRPTKVQKPNPPSQTGTSTFNAATHLKLQPQSAGSHTPFEARYESLFCMVAEFMD